MKRLQRLACAALTFPLIACGDTPETANASAVATGAVQAVAMADADLPTVVVYKSATCGCCEGWVEHLKAAGFTVDARNVRDLMSVKIDAGVPTALSSCHTAIIDGYVVEGHVPAAQLKRLLAERPDIAGIGVPGMPTGSPGMEGANAKPYEVYSFDHAGKSALYAEIDPR